MARPKKKIYPKIHLPSYFKGSLFSFLKKNKVEVVGLGVFELVNIPARKIYHNFSQKNITIKGYKKLKFTQSPELKNTLTEK